MRQALLQALRQAEAPLGAHDLSREIGIPEKDVAAHLEHLARSLPRGAEQIVVDLPTCLECGFAFTKRERLGRPGRCPMCRSTRIDPPRFSIRGRSR